MNYFEARDFLKQKYQSLKISAPRYHVVLGSAMSSALSDMESEGWKCLEEFSFQQMPGFPASTVAGHKGVFRIYQHSPQLSALIQVGRIHGYEGHEPRKVVLPVMASALAGTEEFLLTNAAGGLNPKWSPGSAMVIRDHVNLTAQNPLLGENMKSLDGSALGPRFPDMMHTYDPDWSQKVAKHLLSSGLETHQGVYLGLLGPNYETPAEVQLFHRWGLDAVGMSTVWEALVLKYLGKKIAGISLITNMGCGLIDSAPLDHEEMLTETNKSAELIVKSIFSLMKEA